MAAAKAVVGAMDPHTTERAATGTWSLPRGQPGKQIGWIEEPGKIGAGEAMTTAIATTAAQDSGRRSTAAGNSGIVRRMCYVSIGVEPIFVRSSSEKPG